MKVVLWSVVVGALSQTDCNIDHLHFGSCLDAKFMLVHMRTNGPLLSRSIDVIRDYLPLGKALFLGFIMAHRPVNKI